MKSFKRISAEADAWPRSRDVGAATMAPVVFDECFGWLHPARGETGVLLCNTLGFEQQCIHRAWRMLADHCAQAGFPTLRFDYPGTGDSHGPEQSPEQIELWVESICQAADYLRQETGVRDVVLVGIRLGALLAAYAAARRKIADRLVLVAPIHSGRRFVRALTAAAKLQAHNWDAPAAESPIDCLATRLHPQAVRALESMDTASAGLRGIRHALLLRTDCSPPDAAVVASLQGMDIDVTGEAFAEYGRLMQEAEYSEVPQHAFGRIADWLSTSGRPRLAGRSERAVQITTGDAIEIPQFFSLAGNRFFGMYCRPVSEDNKRIAVMICNTGGDPHHGYGRFSVHLARMLARQGIASLRIDVAGNGDTIEGETRPSRHVYSIDHKPALSAAVSLLRDKGHADIVAFGVCSGAYQALDAAVADERIKGLILVNQQVYKWDGQKRDEWRRQLARAGRGFKQRASSADARPSYTHARSLSRRLSRTLVLHAVRVLTATRIDIEKVALRRDARHLKRSLRTLAARRAPVLIMVGRNEESACLFHVHFGQQRGGAKGFDNLDIVTDIDLQHALGRLRDRETLLPILQRWLSSRMGSNGTAPA